jgi:hypothetical protein
VLARANVGYLVAFLYNFFGKDGRDSAAAESKNMTCMMQEAASISIISIIFISSYLPSQ